MLIVCDIDGTISDCRHRQHLAAAGDWEAFHAVLHLDPPHPVVCMTLNLLLRQRAKLIFLTGRPEEYRQETIDWLRHDADMHLGEEYLDLLMRPKGDYRRDVDVKLDLLLQCEEIQKCDKGNILILDDRDAVVAMWRDNGYTCFQTAQGAF